MSCSLLAVLVQPVAAKAPPNVLLQGERAAAQLRAQAQDLAIPASQATTKKAADVKRDPLYYDPTTRQQGNWVAKAFERIGDFFRNLFRAPQNLQPPNMPMPPDLTWMIYAIYGLLGLAVLTLLYFVVRHFRWQAQLRRRATALLEEDEPERTLDEWLALADEYEREGRHREAVRALYLAMLLKLDENGVARFDRRQTNWEHLVRIEVSPTRPNFDFRAPTKSFDLVWYGHIVDRVSDVPKFRAWYTNLVELLRRKAA